MSISSVFLDSLMRRVNLDIQRRFIVSLLFRAFFVLVVLLEWALLLLFPGNRAEEVSQERVVLLLASLVLVIFAMSLYWYLSNVVFSRRIHALFNVMRELEAQASDNSSHFFPASEYARILEYIEIGSSYEFEVRSGRSFTVLLRVEPFLWAFATFAFALLGLAVADVLTFG